MNRFTTCLGLSFGLLLLGGCGNSGDVSKPKTTATPSLSINDITVNEGGSGNFTVSLSPASIDTVGFSWRFAGGTATAGADFQGTNGSTTLLPGVTSATIPVSVLSDATDEVAESFTVTLENARHANLGRSVGVCTIPGATVEVSFANDIAPIVQGRCAVSGCHGGGSRSGGLSLNSGSYTDVRNARGSHGAFIGGSPISSSSSLFYLVVRPGSTSGLPRMPQSGGFLSTDQQNRIKDWIDQGAKNN
ncbi:MAG: Calx-beta domain-containing protein [Candidatus Eisenbacteria bacterium]